jgi:lipopolysaccharide/colanic/teichoic acid biosynthesis glycosyltransferase
MQAIIPKPFVLAPSESLPDQEYLRQKRLFDLIVVILLSPALLPVFAVCALAVRLSGPGPIFFRQARTGIDGKPFEMLKFRSMVVDAPHMKDELKSKHHNEGPDFKLERDPRVTHVGRLLRKTSLDELPQLWNVLCDDMSLVGPRPTSFGADTYRLWHTERLEGKPGLTGLWQVEKRGDLDFDERVRLDIAYLRNRSLRLDLWILLRTVPAVLKQHGAY